VVRNCQSITVLDQKLERPAVLVARDDMHDLAVLRVTNFTPAATAPLRWNIRDLRVGDAVNVIGFPGKAGAEGRYSYKKTTVTSLVGPTGEPLWIQLASVAQRGNSGGPLLDASGNVIAVIAGMAKTYKVGEDKRITPELIKEADIAITLNTLQDFLHSNAIPYYESSSGLVAYGDSRIEENALRFIRPVHCILSKQKSAQ
jgi:S1-C subfamily serine protease